MKFNEINLKQIIEEETQAELEELREQQILNENIFSMIKDALFGLFDVGFVQNIKEWIAQKVLGFMGVKTDTFFGKLLVNMFGNLTMDDLAAIMSGPEKCVAVTTELAGGATETLVEMIPEMLGVESNGWLSGAVRESFGEAFLKGINLAIGEAICDLDFSSLFTGNKKADVSEVRKRLLEKFGDNASILEEKDWIDDAEKSIKKRGTEGVCTGDKFGSESCPEGSKRYNLAKTFRKMAKEK